MSEEFFEEMNRTRKGMKKAGKILLLLTPIIVIVMFLLLQYF